VATPLGTSQRAVFTLMTLASITVAFPGGAIWRSAAVQAQLQKQREGALMLKTIRWIPIHFLRGQKSWAVLAARSAGAVTENNGDGPN
jgi:hypothetical protein